MRTNARDSEPTLRGEIEYLLQNREIDTERCEPVAAAWTVEALAKELGADKEEVRHELNQLHREGRVTYRKPRSGGVFWKLTDFYHDRWAGIRLYPGSSGADLAFRDS